MRTALTLFALVAGLLGTGCSSGCGSSCDPPKPCCGAWKPNCCNSWDFYIPCNTLCGSDGQYSCEGPVQHVPTATCCAPPAPAK